MNPVGPTDSEQNSASGWWDEPLEDPSDDLLNRAPYAKNAARLISTNHRRSSSVVYGLEGPWGSGKSTVIGFVAAYLSQSQDYPWKVVHFTPWATTGTDALFAEFFSALASAAPSAKGGSELRNRITTYAGLARPLVAAVPVIGAGLAEASRTLEDRLQKPWNEAFRDVASELERLELRILVVVDDIDRLQPGELLDLLKVVRLLGRFPGVDFLLAYDERTVVDTLQDPRRGNVTKTRARAFMEKIVQYPLTMPPLLIGKIVKLLDQGLTEILTVERVEAGFDKHRFNSVVLGAMPSQLATPRAISRFLAQVREQVRMHDQDEIDDVDLVLATFLRVRFPDLFDQLQRWKPDLTRGSSGRLLAVRKGNKGTNWDKLLHSVPEESRADAEQTLQALFPAVRDGYSGRAEPRRFAHPDYFDRYLAQAIPDGDIADFTITAALRRAAGGDAAQLRALVLDDDDEKVTLALSKIHMRYPDITERWQKGDGEAPVTLPLLSAGMAIVDDFEYRAAATNRHLLVVTHWMANVLRGVLKDNPLVDVRGALAKCGALTRRAHVISTAMHDISELPESIQQALTEILRAEGEVVLQALVADLHERDMPTTGVGNAFLYEIVIEAGLLPALQVAIAEGVANGHFTIDDVAARFVGLMYVIGIERAEPSAASFNGRLFSEITGVPARSADHIDLPNWPDASMGRRRDFAHGYLDSVSAVDDGEPDSTVEGAAKPSSAGRNDSGEPRAAGRASAKSESSP